MCKTFLWLDQSSLNSIDDKFNRILNSIELSLVGWAPGLNNSTSMISSSSSFIGGHQRSQRLIGLATSILYLPWANCVWITEFLVPICPKGKLWIVKFSGQVAQWATTFFKTLLSPAKGILLTKQYPNQHAGRKGKKKWGVLQSPVNDGVCSIPCLFMTW